jgi:hypothetical protein
MHGSYFSVAEDGERFETEIPMFVLDDGTGRVLHCGGRRTGKTPWANST